MTTQTQSPLNKIWIDLLNGSLTEEQARVVLAQVRDSSGQPMTPASIESFLTTAAQERQRGLDIGASWAQPKPVSGPIPPGANRDAQGNIIKNVGTRPEEIEPFGAFQRGLARQGLNAGLGGGAFGRFLQGRAAPTSAVFLGQQALRGLLPVGQVEPENAFEQFAGQTRGGNLGLQAQNTFQGLMNMLRGGDPNALPAAHPARAFLTPKDEQMDLGLNLAREAARGRLGGFAARQLLPSNEALLQEFQGGPTGAQNTDFLAYLQRAFGL